MFWWKSLAGDVAKFVATCVACQRNKARRHKPYGLLQPLLVPKKPWHTVTFDFIVQLPKTSRGNDSICVFVDKLTKLVHFVACKEGVFAKKVVEVYVDHVFGLYGLSRGIITDFDPELTSAFCQDVTILFGTLLCRPLSIRKLMAKRKESIKLRRCTRDVGLSGTK
jgi:hypothetical protein